MRCTGHEANGELNRAVRVNGELIVEISTKGVIQGGVRGERTAR